MSWAGGCRLWVTVLFLHEVWPLCVCIFSLSSLLVKILNDRYVVHCLGVTCPLEEVFHTDGSQRAWKLSVRFTSKIHTRTASTGWPHWWPQCQHISPVKTSASVHCLLCATLVTFCAFRPLLPSLGPHWRRAFLPPFLALRHRSWTRMLEGSQEPAGSAHDGIGMYSRARQRSPWQSHE